MQTNKKQDNKACPCRENPQSNDQNNNQSNTAYSECCQAIHQAITKATTAEALMRARYCAYALRNETFLLASWHPDTRPSSIPFEPQLKWINLEIKTKKAGEVNDDTGEIEFVARCKINGKASRIHEISQFKRLDGYWVYLNGILQ